jgi:hypothetical protein
VSQSERRSTCEVESRNSACWHDLIGLLLPFLSFFIVFFLFLDIPFLFYVIRKEEWAMGNPTGGPQRLTHDWRVATKWSVRGVGGGRTSRREGKSSARGGFATWVGPRA